MMPPQRTASCSVKGNKNRNVGVSKRSQVLLQLATRGQRNIAVDACERTAAESPCPSSVSSEDLVSFIDDVLEQMKDVSTGPTPPAMPAVPERCQQLQKCHMQKPINQPKNGRIVKNLFPAEENNDFNDTIVEVEKQYENLSVVKVSEGTSAVQYEMEDLGAGILDVVGITHDFTEARETTFNKDFNKSEDEKPHENFSIGKVSEATCVPSKTDDLGVGKLHVVQPSKDISQPSKGADVNNNIDKNQAVLASVHSSKDTIVVKQCENLSVVRLSEGTAVRHEIEDLIGADKLNVVGTTTEARETTLHKDFSSVPWSIEVENSDLVTDFLEIGIDVERANNVIVHDVNCVEVLVSAEPSNTSDGLALEFPSSESPSTVSSPVSREVPQDNIVHAEADHEHSPAEPRRRRTAQPVDEGTPRKRKKNPQSWKTIQNQQARAKGQAYTNWRGKDVVARVVGAGCAVSCKKTCHLKVPLAERELVFKAYFSTPNITSKWAFINKLVKKETVKRRTTDEAYSRRKMTLRYHIQLSNDQEVEVCKKFFLDTISQSEQVVKTAVAKSEGRRGITSPCKQGKGTKPRILNAVLRNNVKAHIQSFKTVESHYCRKSSKCKFLPETLNMRKMHSMYQMERGPNMPHTATLRQYRHVFKEDFYLKFYKPKKDQCSDCLNWKHKTPEEKSKAGAQEKYEKHIENKETGEALMRSDSSRPKEEPQLCVASYDFEKILYSPRTENSAFFYKSKMKCYNFTIFDHHTKEGFCFVWDQTVAKKGANEVATCLLQFIEKRITEGKISEFIFFSDNCWSQNKNSHVFSMFNMVSVKYSVKITQRYLEKGHTHMDVDNIHARIETRSKHVEIFCPPQWYAMIKTAKVNDPKYVVREMEQEEFKDFKELAGHHNWSKAGITKLREIIIKENSAFIKHDYVDVPKKLTPLLRAKVGRPVRLDTYQLKKVYFRRIPVEQAVVNDLKWFCSQGHIPSVHLPYYESVFAITDTEALQECEDCDGEETESCAGESSEEE